MSRRISSKLMAALLPRSTADASLFISLFISTCQINHRLKNKEGGCSRESGNMFENAMQLLQHDTHMQRNVCLNTGCTAFLPKMYTKHCIVFLFFIDVRCCGVFSSCLNVASQDTHLVIYLNTAHLLHGFPLRWLVLFSKHCLPRPLAANNTTD